MAGPALQVTGVNKYFGTLQALADVTIEVPPGEVRGLVGENGAGKSTLVKIIQGYHHPDSGTISVFGHGLDDAQGSLRVATLHQDVGLVDTMSVVENLGIVSRYGISSGRPVVDRIRPISWRRERSICSGLMAEFGLDIPLAAPVRELSPAQKAMIGMMRVLRTVREMGGGSESLLILDEPTASVSPIEIGKLFEVIRKVAEVGGSVLFISHKIDEVLSVSRAVTVLRAGSVVGNLVSADTSVQQVVDLMAGRVMEVEAGPTPAMSSAASATTKTGDVVLEVDDLTGSVVENASVVARPGEIVGLAGLSGMGQEDLLSVIGGQRQPQSGSMRLYGRAYAPRAVRDAWAAGVRTIPSDRRRRGLWLEGTVKENLVIGDVSQFVRRGAIRRSLEREKVSSLLDILDIRPKDPGILVGRLSGGNQQKVMFGRLFLAQPSLILLEQPTEGVDPSARREILSLIVRLARLQRVGVLVVSTEFEELASICDDVHVFRNGRIISHLAGAELTARRLEAISQGGLIDDLVS